MSRPMQLNRLGADPYADGVGGKAREGFPIPIHSRKTGRFPFQKLTIFLQQVHIRAFNQFFLSDS